MKTLIKSFVVVCAIVSLNACNSSSDKTAEQTENQVDTLNQETVIADTVQATQDTASQDTATTVAK